MTVQQAIDGEEATRKNQQLPRSTQSNSHGSDKKRGNTFKTMEK